MREVCGSKFITIHVFSSSTRDFVLRRRREQDRERRARESAEEREVRLARRRVRDRQRARERRASETAVQREVRLVSRRIRDRARRTAESEERRGVRLDQLECTDPARSDFR